MSSNSPRIIGIIQVVSYMYFQFITVQGVENVHLNLIKKTMNYSTKFKLG